MALIRNLMFKPEILLLDEITTGLDEQTKSLVNGLITHLNQEDGITVLSITHDTQEQQRKGRQLQIVAGRLVHADESSR
ncbi:ABC transporter ATP-binding protein [Latilactobacillus sakei]|nr:ABC transporter ATP-binding protein [Latilactobacillus sakei]USG04210.1 ABC transporter ATP-binding protein [Latilactobacillus sakei]USG06043.1 ABC transporter ATP-binding protein [Latilactobacillus sakei]